MVAKAMSERLRKLYFHDPRAFVIGVEHLCDTGMSDTLAGWLDEKRGLDTAWVESFNASYTRYRERCRTLAERDPEVWFPPRKQNVCIVTAPQTVRPYYLPFHRASWLLYASDFDPALGSPELGAYLFLHTERLCLTQSPSAAVAHNLGYWLLRSDEEIAGFSAAAGRTERPDADAFRELADAQAWIADLHHPILKPLEGEPTERVGKLPHSGLIATASMQPKITRLVRAFVNTTQSVVTAYFASYAPGAGHDAVIDYVRSAEPDVLITAGEGDIVWDPRSPSDTDALAGALDGVNAAVAESIVADLRTVDDATRRFKALVGDIDALPLPADDIEQMGLTYIHETNKRIAYNLNERDMNRTREVSAPYERLMVAARTVHEWCHLAVDDELVHMPAGNKSALARAEIAYADALNDIIAHAPDELSEVAEQERERAGVTNLGAGLRDIVLQRMPDYLANVLARRVLTPEEMETYVRQQVGTLAQEDLGPFGQIARHSYELQYLHLSQVETRWPTSSSRHGSTTPSSTAAW